MTSRQQVGLTHLQDAVAVVLAAYEAARLTLNHDQRKVLRAIIAARIARDIIAEELEPDLDDMQNAA